MASEEVLAIVGGRVIDGLGGDPIDKGTILIRKGLIEAVGPAISVPTDARVVDLRVAGNR